MKKKIIIAFATVMLLALAAVAFAVNSSSVSSRAVAAESCCKGDSCPMKNKDGKKAEKASCCDDCDCCKGDSCPMKKKDHTGHSAEGEKKHGEDHAKGEAGHSCSCCADKKEAPKT